MVDNSLESVEKKYDLELERIVKEIKRQKAKNVLLQFPEGLKPYAQALCDRIEGRAKCNCFIWLGTCFGACDVPIEVERLGVDLIIQFGHSDWSFKTKDIRVVK